MLRQLLFWYCLIWRKVICVTDLKVKTEKSIILKDGSYKTALTRRMTEHRFVIVAFDQNRVETIDDFSKATEDVTKIGEQAKSFARFNFLDCETHAFDGIVRSSKCFDA